MKKIGKNQKKLLKFHEKNDKNWAKKFQFFSILNQFEIDFELILNNFHKFGKNKTAI